MLAARAYADEAELRLEHVEPPRPGPNDVVFKVAAAGVANGVFELWKRGLYPVLPRTLGNEAAGVVLEVGGEVEGLEVGDRVRLHPNLSCRRCEHCLSDREQMCPAHSMIGGGVFGPQALPLHRRYVDGGFAEQILVPAWLVDRLPDAISFDAAAKVHDVADALRAWKAAAVGPGSTVVVTAATGVIGTSLVRLAPLLGIARLIAVARSGERLAQVRALDEERVEAIALDALDEDWETAGGLTRRIRELVPGGPDAVLDFTPEGAATWQAVASLKSGGSGVLMGGNVARCPLPTVAIMVNCWRLTGMRGCTRKDAQEVMRWMEMGVLDIEDLITHRFPLSDIASAVRAVRDRTDRTWMVVINP